MSDYQRWLADYEAKKLVPVEDEELRSWLLDIKRTGTLRVWDPHVEFRMQRIFARLRAMGNGMNEIVDAIEMYVQFRVNT